ncbi:MAG: VIT domain-containing protein [Rhodospirillaceae bacterium]
MNLGELIKALGETEERVNPRFVRYLTAQGIIPPPDGSKRYATYDERHATGIRTYLSLRDAGLSKSAVAEKMALAEQLGVAADAAPAHAVGTIQVDLAAGLILVVTPQAMPGTVSRAALLSDLRDVVHRHYHTMTGPETRKEPVMFTDPLAKFKNGAINSKTRAPMPLVSTTIAIVIDGPLAMTTIRREFFNAGSEPIEATITLPMPVHAVVCGVAAEIDGRRVVGWAKKKTAARASYETAIDTGKSAVLHEEALRGIHVLSVANIPAGKSVIVETAYAQVLQNDGMSALLSIPMTVGEVYGKPRLSDADDLVTSNAVIHKATLSVTCAAGIPTLLRGGALAADGTATIILDGPIVIAVSGWREGALAGIAADGKVVMLTLSASKILEEPISAALLLDYSGSMFEKIRVAGRSVMTNIGLICEGLGIASRDALGEKDRFEVFRFGSHVERIGDCNGESLPGLITDTPSADLGGTELGCALDEVIATTKHGDILLVTDGRTNALDVQSFATVGKRISVVLIGEGALEANVGHLAALTGGSLFVAHADAATAVVQAIGFLRQPVVQQRPIEGAPTKLGTVRGGIVIEADWTGSTTAPEGGFIPPTVVGAVAASLALPLLETEKAAEWAEAHGLVCHLTSLVLVDEVGEAQLGIPSQVKVPLMAPFSSDDVAFESAGLGIPAYLRRSPAPPKREIIPNSSPPPSEEIDSLMAFDDGDSPNPELEAAFAAELVAKAILATEPIDEGGIELTCAFEADDDGIRFEELISELADGLPVTISQINWDRDPNGLTRGVIDSLPPAIAEVVRALCQRPELLAFALTAGLTAERAVIGLLATVAAENGNRTAERIARNIMVNVDRGQIACALRDLGFIKSDSLGDEAGGD